MKKNIAVLLTCFNRKDKTLSCLKSLFAAQLPLDYALYTYLVDDGSTDGTAHSVASNFPNVQIVKGSGDLFWAGGMRLAWSKALEAKSFDAFILLNDDVLLKPDFISSFLFTDQYSNAKFGLSGVYSAPTVSFDNNTITYGGTIVLKKGLITKTKKVTPNDKPQKIDMTNANILWVDKTVINRIGILSDKFTHGLADFDFALRANKAGFPVLLTNEIGGYCENDHGVSWKKNASLKERFAYLKSPTGLAYKEYLYYVRKHFPMSLPYAFIMLWAKTLFPQLWTRFK